MAVPLSISYDILRGMCSQALIREHLTVVMGSRDFGFTLKIQGNKIQEHKFTPLITFAFDKRQRLNLNLNLI